MSTRGYYGIGVEKVSKPMNVGALLRTAHAFGASFVFTIDEQYAARTGRLADTSNAPEHVPLYHFDSVAELSLPERCDIVGIELIEGATELPSFRHPLLAAYVLGSERGSLSPEVLARCAAVVKIPMKFCVNLAVAGALVMYDRMISMGRFAERPVAFGGRPIPTPPHFRGRPIARKPSRREGAD